MKRCSEAVDLKYISEFLEPALQSLRTHDDSELFKAVGPGMAEEAYRLAQNATGRLLKAGWVAGRRGQVTRTMLDALAHLQQGHYTLTADQATIHFAAALRHLRDAAAALARVSAARRSRL